MEISQNQTNFNNLILKDFDQNQISIESPKNKIMLDFILNEGINLKLKVSNNNKLNIFEAITFADIRYYQYIIDYQQKKDINIMNKIIFIIIIYFFFIQAKITIFFFY